MSEVMEIDDNNIKLKSPLGIAEEFFDAEDDVDTIKEDDDDFMKKLEIAISGNKSPEKNTSAVSSPEQAPVPTSISTTVENNEKKENGLNDASTEVLEEAVEESLSKPCLKSSVDEPASELEKLENDLLKDLEDDHENDLESVEKEVEDLLESVLEDENKPDEEEIETSNDVGEEKIVDENSKNEKGENIVDKIENALEITPEKTKDVETNEVENSSEAEIKEPETSTEASDNEKIITEPSKFLTPEDDDSKVDDLLVACEPPRASQPMSDAEQQDNESETSSTVDETPEESSDEKQAIIENGNNEEEVEQQKLSPVIEEDEKMEVEEEISKEVQKDDEASMEEDAEPVEEEPTKEFIPLKLKFVKQFSSAVGKLSRADLEELLIQKITESIMFCSENTDLRARLEKQEKLCENFKKRLDNVKKQYNDLEMIHNRVMKDLKDRPDAPITPVKITRAVGLQVFQPASRLKPTLPPPPGPASSKSSNKRPIENDPPVNGKNSSPDNVKRKKTHKTTPLRPPLSEKERASLEAQEAKEEQKLRTNVSKTVIGGASTVNIPPSVTMTPVSSQNGTSLLKKNSAPIAASQSIDLTDEDDTNSSSSSSKNTPQPPALVAIRGTNQTPSPQRSAYVLKSPTIVATNNSPRVVQYRSHPEMNRANIINRNSHPAPLPTMPAQISKPNMKKIPPRPTININNVPNGIIVSWKVDALSDEHAEIHSYQIYAYEETSAAPSTDNWRHVGDVKALLLPMAVTLTQFQEGQKYYFAVRAMDVHKRLGFFSAPKTWS